MSGIDSSGLGAPGFNVESSGGPAGAGGVGKSGGSATPTDSTIQKSELEELIAEVAAGYPILSPPQAYMTNFDPSGSQAIPGIGGAIGYTQMSMDVDQAKNDIINSMWDTFLQNVHEMADRARQEDIRRWTQDVTQNGPKSGAEYYAYLMALSSTQRADETTGGGNPLAVQFNNAFNQWFVSPADSSQAGNNQGYPSVAFIAGSVAVGSDVIASAIGQQSNTMGYQLSINPLADALVAVGPTSGLPIDSQAASALIAALLYNGAANKATTETIQQAAAGGKPPTDINFAVNYAQNIMSIVTHNIEGNQPLTPQNQLIRLMLSMMALNLLYRAADINPNQPDVPAHLQSLVNQLYGVINANLSSDPASRAAVLASVFQYINTQDSVNSLLNTTRMFASLLNTSGINQSRLEAENT